MPNCIKHSLNIVMLSLIFSPIALAKKQASLNFNKQTVNLPASITGEITYLASGSNNHVLIQNGRSFTQINDIGNAQLSNTQTINMPDEVLFYNKGTLANVTGDSLFYFSGNEVSVHHLATGKLKTLFSHQSIYKGQQSVAPTKSSFVFDANQDGLSDIIVSNFNHSTVYIQTSEGKFKPHNLELAPQGRVTDDGVRFTAHQPMAIDTNNDGLLDIAFQVDNHLAVFLQETTGQYTAIAQTIALNANILSVAEQRKLKSQAQTKAKKSAVKTKFDRLIDLNGDGLVDLVTKEKRRDGMSSNSTFLVRFGQLTSGLLSFSAISDTVMKLNGQGELKIDDFNNDGLEDYYTLGIEIGVGTVMSFMSGSINMDVNFYKMNTDFQFDRKPIYRDELAVSINIGDDDDDNDDSQTLFALADFNGDGLKDLIKQTDDDEFAIYNGGTGRLFAKRGRQYDIDMPIKGNVKTHDFNGDGKADLLFCFGKNKGKSKLTLWLSRS